MVSHDTLIYLHQGDQNAYLKRTGAKYLKEIAEKENIFQLKSGLLIEILNQTQDDQAKSPNK